MRYLLPLIAFTFFYATPSKAPTEELYGNYFFRVEISGIDAGASFITKSFNMTLEVLEDTTNGEPQPRKRPGRAKFSDIVLERPYEFSSQIEQWWLESRSGNVKKRDLRISLVSKKDKNVIGSWVASGAFPVGRDYKVMSAKGNEVAMEELTLAVESIDLPSKGK